jgi:CBS domain containing-hemolysin-like protein
MALSLLDDSERLLSAILFCNLLVNMMYFGLASIVGAKLETSAGSSVAVGFTIACLLILIFFSEMLPKSIAVLAPLPISLAVSAALTVMLRLVGPILPIVKMSNRAAARLLWPSFEPEPEIELADIERAIELGTDDAVLRGRERLALQGLVEMAEMRVDELMRPRSRLTIVTPPLARYAHADDLPASGYLMVSQDGGHSINASINIRMLRPSQLDDIASASEPVIFVAWSARVSQVLESLDREDRAVAIVVNEFGAEIGAVSIDDILRRILTGRGGRDEESGDGKAIYLIQPGRYRVSGSVSLRTLTKQLGLNAPDERTATVAGFIQRHNERRPKVGDSASLDGYEFVVVEMEDDDVVWIEARMQSDVNSSPEAAS